MALRPGAVDATLGAMMDLLGVWHSDKDSKGPYRWRYVIVWRSQKCRVCGEVRYRWQQQVRQRAWLKDGRWVVRSFPVQVGYRLPTVGDAPVITCKCPTWYGPRGQLGLVNTQSQG